MVSRGGKGGDKGPGRRFAWDLGSGSEGAGGRQGTGCSSDCAICKIPTWGVAELNPPSRAKSLNTEGGCQLWRASSSSCHLSLLSRSPAGGAIKSIIAVMAFGEGIGVGGQWGWEGDSGDGGKGRQAGKG